jgi:hypothetical protein
MLVLASTRRSISLATIALGLLASTACTKSSGGGGGGTGGVGGGPVAGAVDMHCAGMPAQATSQSVCGLTAPADAGTDAGTGGSASAYGVTMFNAEGDDDDCKYHVAWTSTPIGEGRFVTFNVVATTKTDGKPLTGAAPMAEVYLNTIHPAPNTTPDQSPTEGPPGTYAIGPIEFDAPGQWTVRFHFYEVCSDISPESPHGHAAFYVDVP